MDRAPHLRDMSSGTGDNLHDEGLDYKEIAREVLARIDQRLADMERADQSSEASLGPEAAGDSQPAFVTMARRGLIGLLLAASVVAATFFLWSHSDTTKRAVGQSVARLDLPSVTPIEKPEPGPPATPKPIAEAAPAPAAPLPRAAPDTDNPPPAPVPPELAELMRKVESNVADLAQAVTELRLAQQQASDDNAKSIDDIKASLGQMARTMAMSAMARAPEPAAQPKLPAPASRATVSRPRRSPMYRLPGDTLESEFVR